LSLVVSYIKSILLNAYNLFIVLMQHYYY
jgi:hypothetical protein